MLVRRSMICGGRVVKRQGIERERTQRSAQPHSLTAPSFRSGLSTTKNQDSNRIIQTVSQREMPGSTILSLPLTSLPPSATATATATSTSSCRLYSSPVVAVPASRRLHSKRLHLRTNPSSSGVHSLNLVIPKASSSSSSDVDNTADSPPETTDEKVTVDKLPLETKLQERMEQKLKMKLAKKIRLRRKRLVRKRRMRKKGRWPPSKMKKLKNV